MIYHDEARKEIALKLPDHSREWLDVLSQERILALLEHLSSDRIIDVLPNTTPTFGPLYACSASELKSMKDYLYNNSMEGKIPKSN